MVTATDLIDVGDLSLQNLGSLSLNAQNGDVRGDGTLDVAGSISVFGDQVYPTTAGRFTIAAYDYRDSTGASQPGSVTFYSSGSGSLPQLPLSAGGQLDVYASNIVQGGVLRAPIGTINLGWNGPGSGTLDPSHIDQDTGQAVPTTKTLTLSAGSVTSVSASDPQLGLIPYGINLNGTAWIDPTGADITVSGVPGKSVNLSGAKINDAAGAAVDINGGGDLYAYEWISGTGGTNDVLSPAYVPNPSTPSLTSFAVIPGYQPNFAPYATYATSNSNLGTDPGYVASVNGGAKVGDEVYLNASSGLPAGNYTVLPARYALLPGAFLITPVSGALPVGTTAQTDGSNAVSGYRFNDLAPGGPGAQPLLTLYNVATGTVAASTSATPPPTVARDRSQYADFYANSFLSQSAQANEAAVPQLPEDAGQLVFEATTGLAIQGHVSAQAATGGGWNRRYQQSRSHFDRQGCEPGRPGAQSCGPRQLQCCEPPDRRYPPDDRGRHDDLRDHPLHHGRQFGVPPDGSGYYPGCEQQHHAGGGLGHRTERRVVRPRRRRSFWAS